MKSTPLETAQLSKSSKMFMVPRCIFKTNDIAKMASILKSVMIDFIGERDPTVQKRNGFVTTRRMNK